ncbi:hypothetical protein PGTUg99_016300, partial [Puccinia graminis f. sp. tritici]
MEVIIFVFMRDVFQPRSQCHPRRPPLTEYHFKKASSATRLRVIFRVVSSKPNRNQDGRKTDFSSQEQPSFGAQGGDQRPVSIAASDSLSLEATGVIEIKPSTSVGNRQTSTIHAMLVKPSCRTRKTSVRKRWSMCTHDTAADP